MVMNEIIASLMKNVTKEQFVAFVTQIAPIVYDTIVKPWQDSQKK